MWVALREALGLSERVFPFEAKARKLHLDAKKRVRLEPDLSWWEGRRCVWVGDAKYKRITVKGVKHPDIYQMLSYTTATGLDTGMLIYAKGEAEPVIHDIPMAGRSIEVRALDLSGAPDERMSSYWIRSWAREPPPSLPDAGRRHYVGYDTSPEYLQLAHKRSGARFSASGRMIMLIESASIPKFSACSDSSPRAPSQGRVPSSQSASTHSSSAGVTITASSAPPPACPRISVGASSVSRSPSAWDSSRISSMRSAAVPTMGVLSGSRARASSWSRGTLVRILRSVERVLRGGSCSHLGGGPWGRFPLRRLIGARWALSVPNSRPMRGSAGIGSLRGGFVR